jgi:nitrite reductase/ring-hydroxylating ferredoxin subunit/DMSO/TMAO reductase YedYZ heme-binding membrane subunit
MSVQYEPVQWNRFKLFYDAVLLIMVAVYIQVYLNLAPQFQNVTRPIDGATLRMQAFGTCAFLLLTVILCIGPLARLDRRFLPLLYNRRHFGVIACAVALVHASHVLGWYFAFSPTAPYEALLSSNTSYGQVLGFPFEVFGMFALAIMVVMAVTSHDFWLSFLTPSVWKAIHMAVYLAYGALVLHIGLGYLQDVDNPAFAIIAAVSIAAVSGLHLAAAQKERSGLIPAVRAAQSTPESDSNQWVIAGCIADTIEDRGLVVTPPNGEKIAVFRYEGKLSAISNVCAHQNGPLGEGRIVFGCVTCPWHGFQYDPATGRAPAPFTEKIATYNLKLDGDRILVDPNPNAPGTAVEPVVIPGGSA